MMMHIPTREELAANSRELDKLHPANRFRLMFGQAQLTDNMNDQCNTEEAVIAMIRQRGETGRRKYGTSMDRRDLTADEWIQHFQEELADALQYAERMKGAAKLLREAREIMLAIVNERQWECAEDWIARHDEQFENAAMSYAAFDPKQQ